MIRIPAPPRAGRWLAAVSAVLAVGPALAAAPPAQAGSVAASGAAPASAAAAPHRKTSPYRSVEETNNAKTYYRSVWGLDRLKVSYTSSGNLIRFSYRVVDPKLAKSLGEKEATPHLYGERSHALLQIPVMEKIGQLRQTGVPIAGQEYWMVFSNKGDLVKRGDRVDVLIGNFHADKLLVE